jgi:ferric-chelate reductase
MVRGLNHFTPSYAQIASVYKYTIAGTFRASLLIPSNAWGYTGLICVDALYVLSTPFWRQKAYNIFLGSHILSSFILVPAVRSLVL